MADIPIQPVDEKESVSIHREETDASSDILSAAGIGVDPDDPTLPCLTLRMWVIGVGFCVLGCGLNTLYTFRYPSISLSQSAIQFLAYPVGKAWEMAIPNWSLTLFGRKIEFNPGPFNQKEHILIYIMANLSFATRLSADVLTEQRVFYGLKAGWAFEIVITLATILIGFSLAGIFRPMVVDPPSLLWPGTLANTALNHTLHTKVKGLEEKVSKWKISRYTFFMITFSISFCWYWFPDFIFPALSYFTFLCWIFPKNRVVNQIFGMKSGLGVLPLTFDWSQIAYIGSPLVVPAWAIANVLASLIFWIYIVSPALYYSNVWSSAYLPIQSNSVYDNTGAAYNVTKVIDKKKNGIFFDFEKYGQYSRIYLPTTYALNIFGLSFATIVSLFMWLALEKRKSIVEAIKAIRIHGWRKARNVENCETASYKHVPTWWYLATGIISLFLAMFACEYWPVQLHWYGALFAVLVSSVFFLPLTLVFATTNTKINIEVFCRIVAGYVFEGKVLANIWFFDLGYVTGVKGLMFAEDMKFGIYCNVPSRDIFIVQLVAIIVSSFSQVGVIDWALANISHICTNKAANGFTCPYSKTHFNTSTIWGAIGPRRFFAEGEVYRSLLYFFLIGALVTPAVHLLKRRFPTSFLRHAHMPLFFGGLNYLPPASGTNYGSWAIVGLVFGCFIQRRHNAWWRRYVYVLSSALDSSVAIAGVIIFFAVFYSGASSKFNWWGTMIYTVGLAIPMVIPCAYYSARRTATGNLVLSFRYEKGKSLGHNGLKMINFPASVFLTFSLDEEID